MKWKTAKIGDVCQIVSGTTPSTNIAEYWGGEFNWIAPAEIEENSKFIFNTQKTITQRAVNETSMRLLQVGTVLLSSRAPIGKVAIAATEMYCNQGFKNLICSDEIHNEFLFWFLKGKKDFLNSLGRGATFKEISKSIVASVEIPLPPPAEQRRIAAILDKADAIRRKRQQSLKLADSLLKSVFLDMFGDPVTNPRGWEKGTIRDIVSDASYGTSKPAADGGKYIYLRMNNITYGGSLDLTNVKHIDATDSDLKKYSVRKGDVLFNRTNSKELVGKTCVFTEDTQMIIAGYIIRVCVNSKAVPQYLSAILNSSYGKTTLIGMCKSIIGQANINAQELQDIKILIPPVELQRKFANIVAAIEARKRKLNAHLAKAGNAFKSLQQSFFG